MALRILFLTSDLAGTGANYVRATCLGKALASMGHAVTVVAGAPGVSLRSGGWISSGMEVIHGIALEPPRLRRSGFGAIDLAGRIGLLRGKEFDIVHAFGHRPSGWGPIPLRRLGLGLPVADWADWFGRGGIADERGWLGRQTVGRIDMWLETSRGRWACALTVATHHLAQMALALGFPPDRILNIRSGASVDIIHPMPKEPARSRFGLPLDVPVVLHAGLSAWDQPYVMATFDEVTRLRPDACLALVGGPRKAAAEWADRNGWRRRLFTIPHVPHDRIGEVLACGDVMLLPFPATGMNLGRFPSRAGDYMAAGRPIVTNPTGDLGDFVQNERVGLAVENDPRLMAQAVVRLLEDTGLSRELGENGRRAAEGKLAWPLVAGKVMNFYGQLLGQA